ncbi:ciliated left-right organizer metallopeptidase-like isoform X2 [Brachyhypopomus gauderio]|uniref:ciliated left-right organizer metallopeptidase-like isoform X2 n=1 Tax=Brachyhypopomus gauderio TaxID=698409 RepID=UPI00404333CF
MHPDLDDYYIFKGIAQLPVYGPYNDQHIIHCFQMMAFQSHATLLLLPCLLCVLGKCLFDEVQSSIRVVAPPTSQLNSSDWALNTSGVSGEVSVIAAHTAWATPPWTTQNQQKTILQNSRFLRYKQGDTNAAVHPQPIRITTWTPRESPVLSHREAERLGTALSEAINTVSKLLSVMRRPGRLLLNRDINKYCRFVWRNSSSANFNRCGRANDNYQSERCLGVTIPDDHLSGCIVYPHPDHPILKVLKADAAGVPDTDFLLYVHTESTIKCRADSSVLSYSAHCQTDSAGRPVAGVVVICRALLSKEGFSNEHLVQVMNTDEMGQTGLFSPGVVKALQTHFNSTRTDLGAPLENQDAGSRGVSSHWEARVLQGSIMTALLTEPSLVRIDPITLSALQDTGWYSINLNQAQSLLWGENEGALFGSVSTCRKPSAFFCTGSGLGCHYLHLHKGACQSDQYLDGCRIYKPLANASECWKEGNSRGSSEEEWSGEIYHTDSRCFLSSLVREDHSRGSVSVAGRCYRHRCAGRNRYQIQVVGSAWLDCPAGKSIQVNGYRGTVFCPDKRLCYYNSIVPPTSTPRPLPSAPHPSTPRDRVHSPTQRPVTSQHHVNFDPTPLFSASAGYAEIAMVTVLNISAVLSLLATVTAIYRKCRSARVRVHVGVEVPYVV